MRYTLVCVLCGNERIRTYRTGALCGTCSRLLVHADARQRILAPTLHRIANLIAHLERLGHVSVGGRTPPVPVVQHVAAFNRELDELEGLVISVAEAWMACQFAPDPETRVRLLRPPVEPV